MPHPLLRIANGLSGGRLKSLDEAVDLYGQMAFTSQQNNSLLEERIAELELAIDDAGYQKLDESERQFSKATVNKIADMARVYWLKNPLIKRSTATQANYVFGRGMSVSAIDDDVQEIVDNFMNDTRNRSELTGEQAMLQKETELQVYANLFFTFFTDQANGATRVCTIPLDEIKRIIFNPDDSHEPWYYWRVWRQPKEPGSNKYEQCEAMYPDIHYSPKGGLPKNFNGIPVMKNNPVYHVKTNCTTEMDYGVSEIYSAIDWAKAYKEFLEDWYSIVKSLSKFSWKATAQSGAQGIQQAQAQIQKAVNPADGDLPGQNAQVWMSTDNFDLEPITKSGATVSVDDGRRALLMVCAATGIFEHYFGDPSTGNLATATAMEQPMLLMFNERQKIWQDTFTTIINYVIDQAALKPLGKIHGALTYDDYGEVHVDTGETDRTFEVKFPPILDEDVNERVDAIVKSVTLGSNEPAGTIDLKSATTELLTTLGMDTTLVQTLFPEDVKPWNGEAYVPGEEEAAVEAAFNRVIKDLQENGTQ